MVFETDLTLKDFDGLNWLMSKHAIRLFALLVGLFFGGTLFAKAPEQLPLLCVLVLVIFAAALAVGRLYIKWRSKAIYNRASVSEVLKLVIDDRGIIQTSDSGETELLWEDVYRVKANKDCYFVFLNAKQAFYFPKRNFAQGKEKQFLHIVRDHVSAEKIKIK